MSNTVVLGSEAKTRIRYTKSIKLADLSSKNSRSLYNNSQSQLKPKREESSVTFFEFSSEIAGNELRFQEGVQDFELAIKTSHEILLRYLSYINFCYTSWKSKIVNTIDKNIQKNISSINSVSSTFLKLLKDYEKQGETAKPLPLQQKQIGPHSQTQSVYQQEQYQTNKDIKTKAKIQMRETCYQAWMNEIKGMRKTVKSIEKDSEIYLKYFKNLYILFLTNRELIQDFGTFNTAWKLNSNIILTLFERQITKKINFHNKALRDYHYRLNFMQVEEFEIGNCNAVLNFLEINMPKSADKFMTSLETLIQECHSQLDDAFKFFLESHVKSKVRKIDELLTSITQFYQNSGQLSKTYFHFLPRSLYKNESERTISEYKRGLEIPEIEISLIKEGEDEAAEDTTQSNSTSYSMINRSFQVQKKYESSKSTIIGHSFKNLLKKSEKYLKMTTKQSSIDFELNYKRVKKVVGKENYLNLIAALNKAKKTALEDLETNRTRARMYVRYKMDLDMKSGLSKKNLDKYLAEIDSTTTCHFQKIQELKRLFLTFSQKTHRDYSAFMKIFLSESEIIPPLHLHKLKACTVILRSFQLEFSTMAEIAHSRLLSVAQEIDMKQSLAYAITEFVKGLKWADHNFMKCVVDSSTETFSLLRHCYVSPILSSCSNPHDYNTSSGSGKNGSESPYARVKTVDVDEAIQVINLYFAGYLNSQSIPEDSSEALVEMLKNLSEYNSQLSLSSSPIFSAHTDMSAVNMDDATKRDRETQNEIQMMQPVSHNYTATDELAERKDKQQILVISSETENEDRISIINAAENTLATSWTSKYGPVENDKFNFSTMFCTEEDV